MRYFNRDISWLGFNERVLLEAGNAAVPLYERIKFLSIFSSNLDEFFRVRYPALKTLDKIKDNNEAPGILQKVQDIINGHLEKYGHILTQEILPALKKGYVHLYYNEDLLPEHISFVTDYFYTQALSFLQPVVLATTSNKVALQNNELYFIATLEAGAGKQYAIINIPQDHLPRFISIPSTDNIQHFIFLDDIIRYNVKKLFPSFIVSNVFSIKLTRNADINIADEWSDVFEDQVVEMMQNREKGMPTRLLYEPEMPADVKQFVQSYFDVEDDSMVQGGRYHNLKDFIKLPNPVGSAAEYVSMPSILHKGLAKCESVFEAVRQRDILLHFPYHSYRSVLRFFNEAAIDPQVEEISVTLYRVASDSFITNALISAARNGKKVTAFVELKARFDEANNLNWAKRMKAAGVQIIYSIPGIKVHAKIALVKRKEGLSAKYYGLLSTGNFNEGTARFYTDNVLLTTDKEMTTDMDLLFAYLQARQQPSKYPFIQFKKLLVAGFNFFEELEILVDREIKNKENGKEAGIIIKLNNLQEPKAIELLYKASNAGIRVDLIIRGICCLIPGVQGMSENISVRKIIGRYLEHSRVYIFKNAGDEEIYSGSSDLMTRNLFRRIEVIFPVIDAQLKKELGDMIDLQLNDNVQAVVENKDGQLLDVNAGDSPIDAQRMMYEYVAML